MNLPLYMKDVFGYEAGLVLAVVIGFFFGFALERAGFGSAENIVSQFYLNNMRVLKVMFTAVVTAALGLAALAGFGLLDMAAVSTPPSFLWAQVVGGLLVGVGMVVSGYCPGTSVVAAASGNLDGVLAYVGIIVGSVLFGFFFPLFEGLYLAAPLHEVHFPELLGLPRALLAAAVLVVAVGAFLGGEKVERLIARRKGTEPPDVAPATRNRTFAVLGGVAVLALVGLGFGGRTPAAPADKPYTRIRPAELAAALVQQPGSLHLVDLRAAAACKAVTIPGAICLPEDGPAFFSGLPPTRKLVLFGAGTVKLPAAALRFGGAVSVLAGGYEAFRKQVLTKPEAPANPTPELLAEYRLRTALYGHFTGRRVEAARVTTKPVMIQRAIKKGGGC